MVKRTEEDRPVHRGAFMVAIGSIEVREIRLPTPGQDDVLIRVDAVGVCGSDTHFFTEGHIGDLIVTEPLILGHEAAGTIVDVGRAVDAQRVGQRVAIEPQRTCRKCRYCKEGQYNLCSFVEFFGCPPRAHGAFAEHVVVRSDFAHPVDSSLSSEEAAMLEPLSVAIAAIRKVGLSPGDNVLITGAGPIGLLTARTAALFGASTIMVSDPVASRREWAERYGATATAASLADIPYLAVDVFIDASGSAQAIKDGLRHCRPGAHVGLVGMGADEISLPLAVVQHRELVVHGVFRYANTWPVAIKLAEAGVIDLLGLVTERFAMHELEKALLYSRTHPHGIKAMVDPHDFGD